MIYYSDNGWQKTNVTCWKFPDGTVGVNINVGGTEADLNKTGVIDVTVKFGDVKDERGSSLGVNDILACLAQTVDELRQHFPNKDLQLVMPYVPYARQDRRFKPGDAHGMRFLANVINGMGFSAVIVVDPHSDVVQALLNRCHIVDQFEVFKNIYPSFGDTYIMAPDLGAVKKSQTFAEKVGAKGVIICEKVRGDDGKPEVKVLTPITEDVRILLLDDICDGGATFISASKAIDRAVIAQKKVIENIDLAVTHSIFSAGLDELTQYFDTIHTTSSFISDKDHPDVKVVELG